MQPMSDREREIIRLREQEGLTFKELGARFGISGGRANQIYARALSKKRLSQEGARDAEVVGQPKA